MSLAVSLAVSPDIIDHTTLAPGHNLYCVNGDTKGMYPNITLPLCADYFDAARGIGQIYTITNVAANYSFALFNQPGDTIGQMDQSKYQLNIQQGHTLQVVAQSATNWAVLFCQMSSLPRL